jgi:drug/metabolite transporter (DMT)-like permease
MTQPVQADASTFDDVVPAQASHVPPARTRSNLLLLLVALIWGSAFVAQAIGTRSVGAFTFTGLRFALGAAVVAPFAWLEWRTLRAQERQPRPRDVAHIAGLGTLLFLGAAMQQIGMLTTTVTNAGFLTALYIPLVPVLGWIVSRHVPHWTTWFAAAGCTVGTWALTRGGASAGLSNFKAGDWWVIASSVPWAAHVMLVGRAANRLHGAMLVACGQFIACSALALMLGVATEPITAQGLRLALGAIIYTGVLSVGLGFTLQVVAQRHARAADAAIVLSSETVFAAAFGAVFMGDRIGAAGFAGCALILACILMVQLQPIVWRWFAPSPASPA